MKITYFRLKGYIKVLNGMGLDEIVIPFNTFKNRIVLVQGENGCAKSTIIAALTPNPDSSDSFRTDVFIDGNGSRQIIEYPAEKEIHYVSKDEDGSENYYAILIQSIVDESRTRRTTKAFISKNGEELNPNGNVTSFKEIRDSIMGIDPIYLDLSSISSENRGIVDMIPSERRKYMASYIGSLDTYNNIFKVISKKVTSLKSYMNTLNAKIYELGNESELRLRLAQLETELEGLNKSRDNLLKELASAEATVNLIDPEMKMQSLYTSISERLESLNFEIQKNHGLLVQVYRELNLDESFNDFAALKVSTEKDIKDYQDKITKARASISTNMSLNEAALSSLESDRTILAGLNSNMIQSNIESAVVKLQEEIDVYDSYLTPLDMKILEKTTLGELTELRESIIEFAQEISSIEEFAGADIFIKGVESCMQQNTLGEFESHVLDLRRELVNCQSDLAIAENEVKALERDIEELNRFDSTRPKECRIDSCPYIAKYMDLKKSGSSKTKLDEVNNRIAANNRSIGTINEELKYYETLIETIRRLDMCLSRLLSKKSTILKLPEIDFIVKREDVLKDKLKSFHRFSGADLTVVSSYIEKSSTFEDLKKAREQMKDLQSDLKVYRNNKSLIDSLTRSIEKNEKEYSSREEEIKSINKDIIFMESILAQLSAKLLKIEAAIGSKAEQERLEEEKNKLKEEFESVKDKIKLVKEKVDSVNKIKNELARIEESIKPLSETINRLNYNLSNIVGYQEEFKDSADKYEKMLFIRNACSPGNGMGIQSEYIKRYMNDIIIDCNKMLGYMFGGTIQLDVPIINEKQFSIPFLGPNGIVVPDISNGSTAQKSMIGLVFSCVAMMKSSLKYNIPRFDEIDGGLDQQNRITFINVLNQILDFMNSEQCIICSHNTEFDTQSTTRLLCSHAGIRIEQ